MMDPRIGLDYISLPLFWTLPDLSPDGLQRDRETAVKAHFTHLSLDHLR